jgi:hypothetical protein
MKTQHSRWLNCQRGVVHLPVILACLVIVAIFAIGWTVAKRQPNAGQATVAQDSSVTPQPQPGPVSDVGKGQWLERPGGPDSRWVYEGGTPSRCPSPLLKNSPVDVSKVPEYGFPGQWRGNHYKAHGAMRFTGSAATDIKVKMPLDAKLIGLKRYMESGEIQYLVELVNDCGIKIRFDHIFALSPEFEKLAATTPPPSDDTKSVPTPELFGQQFKAGELVGTAVGHPATNNIGVDFGVYDLRQVNEVSKNAQWADLHRNESSQTFYGVCWLPMLPKDDAAKLKSLYGVNYSVKDVSDYCSDAPDGTTMQYNGGKP